MTTSEPSRYLALMALDIISEMFQYGVIHEENKYFSLDLRTMTDQDAIETICNMDADGLITSNLTEDHRRFYVQAELIAEFVAENWRLNK